MRGKNAALLVAADLKNTSALQSSRILVNINEVN